MEYRERIVEHWKYTDIVGRDYLLKALEFPFSNKLCWGTFVDDTLVYWVTSTR